MASGWLIFFGLLWAYLLLIFWLVRSGRMKKWNMSLAFGIVIMVRTEKGKGAIDWLAKARRFWNIFGDIGIVTVLLIMAGFTFLMFLIIAPSLDPESGIQPAGASEIFAIPGINPFIPLWYGLIGLIVTLVVHEGGHGVLARANDLKVKSLGLLYAIVPIGAFVEPDEDEIREASLRKRLRVFSAGPMVNVVVGLLVLVAFGALMGAATPMTGAALISVTADSPADMAGIMPGDLIVSIEGSPVADFDQLNTALAPYAPGDTIQIATADQALHSLTLTDRWSSWSEETRADVQAWGDRGRAICRQVFPGTETSADWGQCADMATQDAVMGVGIFRTQDWVTVVSEPFGASSQGVHFLNLIQLPLGEIRGAPIMGSYLPTFTEAPFHEPTYWAIANSLFWIFWLNVLVGTFNALPMLPLDGGHIFRDAVAGLVQKVRPSIKRETRDRIVGKAALVASLTIFGIILISIFGPRLAPLFI